MRFFDCGDSKYCWYNWKRTRKNWNWKKTDGLHPTMVAPLEPVQDDVHQPLISIDAKCFVAVVAVVALVVVPVTVVVVADGGNGTVVVVGGSWSNSNWNPWRWYHNCVFSLATVDVAASNVVGGNGRSGKSGRSELDVVAMYCCCGCCDGWCGSGWCGCGWCGCWG